jgi:formylglycine-generating enzyme required for sulfatase activity
MLNGEPPTRTNQVIYWKRDADGYRLPTAAEWEYACRAGTETAYNSGEDNVNCYEEDIRLDPLAWYEWNSDTGYGRNTHPVGLKTPNAWGLYDMHGNVFEWCWDWYAEDYYGGSPSVDPVGPETGTERVLRGGHFLKIAKYCRVACRTHTYPTQIGYIAGLRPVRTVFQ